MAHKEESCSNDILSILRGASGGYVSGEYLSQCLGMTRTAIWKRMAALKKEGFIIEASTRKGYRLKADTSSYGRLAIMQGLSTRHLGRELKFYEEVDSTSTQLKQLAAEGAPHGTVIIADCQNAGRGRLGRSFSSVGGKGIWMSVLLRPELHPSEVQSLTLAAPVAVLKALEPLKIPGVGIKWPNDILIGKKKICGILTELSAELDRVNWVIAGIGLNVNHASEDFPEELLEIASSLSINDKDHKAFDRSSLAAGILNQFEEVYDHYLDKGSSWIVEEWKRYNLTLGKKVRLISQQGETIGMAYDLLPDGKLVVRKDDGTSIQVLSGEISLREL